jgi:hypothetical protein
MDFRSVDTTNHLIVPLGYNRVLRQVRQAARVHCARTQAEIHSIALSFPSKLLYVPKIYDIYDKSYSTEFILHGTLDLLPVEVVQKYPALFVELFHFKEFMMKEGYFMRGIKLCKLAPDRWAIFDFSNFGFINKLKVKFPKEKCLYTLEQAEHWYGLQLVRETKSQEDEYNGLYN